MKHDADALKQHLIRLNENIIATTKESDNTNSNVETENDINYNAIKIFCIILLTCVEKLKNIYCYLHK